VGVLSFLLFLFLLLPLNQRLSYVIEAAQYLQVAGMVHVREPADGAVVDVLHGHGPLEKAGRGGLDNLGAAC
jgi:hypothetical protein